MIILGRLLRRRNRSPFGGMHLELQREDGITATCEADDRGRFVLRLDEDVLGLGELVVRDRAGLVLARKALTNRDVFGEVPITLPGAPVDATSARPPEPEPMGSRFRREPLERLRRFSESAITEGGLEERQVTWVEEAVERLEALVGLSVEATRGFDGALDSLARLVASEEPIALSEYPRDRQAPGDQNDDRHLISPEHLGTLMFAGLALDYRFGRHEWSGRLAMAHVRRAEALSRLLRFAEDGFSDGKKRYATALTRLRQLGGPSSPDASLGDLLGNIESLGSEIPFRWGHRMIGRRRAFNPPFPDLGFPPRPVPEPIELLDPLQLEWLNCLGLLIEAAALSGPPDPPVLESIDPDAVCSAAGAKVTFRHPVGSESDQEPDEWMISIGGKGADVLHWGPDGVEVTVPPGVLPGCNQINWVADISDLARALNELRAGCRRYFRGLPPVARLLTLPITTLSVIGPPAMMRLDANGVTTLYHAESCTPVALRWQLESEMCPNTKDGAVSIDILENDGPLIQAAPLNGEIAVTSEADAEYELVATASTAATVCDTSRVSVKVIRYHQLHLATPKTLFRAGEQVAMTVRSSCPAPAGGIDVTIESDHPNRLPGGSVTIQKATTTAVLTVTAGSECGAVALVASAVNHVSAQTPKLTVVGVPKLQPLTTQNGPACTPSTVCVTGSCLAEDATLALVRDMVSTNMKTTGRTNSDPTDPVAGPSTLCGTVPALEPGDYHVVVRSAGYSVTAGTLLLGRPDVTLSASAQPQAVQVCGTTPVTIRAETNGANRIVITDDAGKTLVDVSRPTMCGDWEATSTVTLSDSAKFTVEAYQSESGVPKKTTVEVQPASSISTVTDVVLHNSDQQRTVYVYKVKPPPPGYVNWVASREGSIGPGAGLTVTFSKCELAYIRATRTDSSEAALDEWFWNSGLLLGYPGLPAPYFNI